jgi:hypothetical protein
LGSKLSSSSSSSFSSSWPSFRATAAGAEGRLLHPAVHQS